jgi:hypothetical protein
MQVDEFKGNFSLCGVGVLARFKRVRLSRGSESQLIVFINFHVNLDDISTHFYFKKADLPVFTLTFNTPSKITGHSSAE